jgi:predicted ATPase/class 3 adenylate cyclase
MRPSRIRFGHASGGRRPDVEKEGVLGGNRPLPVGVVTLLMTDVAGSTRLWEERPDIAGAVMERHEALIGARVHDQGGVLIRSKGEGDSTFSVFADACGAARAGVEIQRALDREPWPDGAGVRVRAAIYTGEVELREGDYYGAAPNRCARLRAAAHPGQTVCSQSTEPRLADLTGEIVRTDLGLHRLRDVARAERVFQLSHRELRAEFPPLRTLAVRQNLPRERTRFVGRDVDVAAIRKQLEVRRLVTLTGVGGCGKTRLAIKAASGLLERFPDGVFFGDLAPVSEPEVVASAVAAAVGFPRMSLGTGSGRPASELVEFLSTREVLLVLDNCEHVIDACAALVDQILERCPGAVVLATSREALDLQGEQVHPVSPLPLPSGDLSEISDAVQLFCERAAAVRPDFVVSALNVSDIAEICRRLDGIPLAIELAAAQIPQFSPRQLVERLGDRLQLFAGGRRQPSRQRSLQGALDWSHELLTDDERTVFRRLSAFPGSFTPHAAVAVCGEAAGLEPLPSLLRKSLIVTEDDGMVRRYRMLETVRAYARAKLVDAREGPLVRDRHRDHFLAWAEAIPPELTYLDPDGAIRREQHNLRAALTWSERQDRWDLVGRLASTMNRIWIGDVPEGRRWLTGALDGLADLDAEHQVRVLAIAAHVAVLAIEAGDGELARRAVAADERPGVWSSLAHGLLCLNHGLRGFLSKDEHDAAAAERLGRKAVELAPEPLSRGLAWFWLGQARVLLDDLDGAVDALEQGSADVVPGGDMSVVCLALLAVLRHLNGEHEEALAVATDVLERSRSYEQSGLWAWALYTSLPYALELGHRGRHAEALDFMRDLLEDNAVPATPGVMTSVVVVLAALAVLRGDRDASAVLLDYAGNAIMTSGVRTPVDMALYSDYLRRHGDIDDGAALRNRTRAAAMSVSDALALGLRAAEPSA